MLDMVSQLTPEEKIIIPVTGTRLEKNEAVTTDILPLVFGKIKFANIANKTPIPIPNPKDNPAKVRNENNNMILEKE